MLSRATFSREGDRIKVSDQLPFTRTQASWPVEYFQHSMCLFHISHSNSFFTINFQVFLAYELTVYFTTLCNTFLDVIFLNLLVFSG